MKSVFLIIIFCCLGIGSIAQISFFPKALPQNSIVLGNTDTLGYDFYLTQTWGILKYNPVGYVFGNNLYNDKAKIQVYKVTEPHQIQSVFIGFGLKRFNSADSSSHISLRLYNLDKSGFANGGSQACPGSYFYNKDIPLYTIDTTNLMLFNVDSFAQSVGNFGVGVDFSGLNSSDSIVLLSTNGGTTISAQTSWETSMQNQNYTILNSWGIESTPAIFPVATPSTSTYNTNFTIKVGNYAQTITIFNEHLSGQFKIYNLLGEKILEDNLKSDKTTINLKEENLNQLLILEIIDNQGQILAFKKLILTGNE